MAAILRALRPQRNELRKLYEDRPNFLPYDFPSTDDRDEWLPRMETFKGNVSAKRATFHELYEKLLNIQTEDEELQKQVEDLAESDSEFLMEIDALLSDLNIAREKILKKQLIEKVATDRAPVPADDVRGDDYGQVPTRSIGVKLPKLQLCKFDGSFTKWQEFWDSFSASVHNNQAISQIDKMNYLKAQLTNEAKLAISGLTATADNYTAAVNLLTERFGNPQLVIDAHYTALQNLSAAPNQHDKLRSLVDAIEQHLNSLEALGEDVNHRHFISAIKSKLPFPVIVRLEEQRGTAVWDVATLRENLRKYLSIREAAEQNKTAQQPESNNSKNKTENKQIKSKFGTNWKSTTEALFSGNSRNPPTKGCAYCESSTHWSDECTDYPTVNSRKGKLKGNCFGCLRPGHTIDKCRKLKRCYYCKKENNHHSSLCPQRFSIMAKPQLSAVAVDQPKALEKIGSVHVENTLIASDQSVTLQTATVEMQSLDKKIHVNARLVLDSASQRSYISESLSHHLNLKAVGHEKLTVNTFGSGPPKLINTSVVELQIKTLDGTFLKVTANVVPVITGSIQRIPINFQRYSCLIRQLPLADSIPTTVENKNIDFLLGNDYFWDVLTGEKIELSPGLYLVASKFGWIISGRFAEPRSAISTNLFTHVMQSSKVSSFPIVDEQVQQKLDIRFLWDLETLGIKETNCSLEDEVALKNFNDTIVCQNKRYFVTWPWKESSYPQSNFQLSLGRLNSLIRRHKNDRTFFEKYQNIIQEQLEKGIIEEVPDGDSSKTLKHYLPHHAVITPDKTTTKLRIVYDGSAKTKSVEKSLNECLLRGPVMLEDVVAILLRFRLNKVALAADIEKAFLQVGLQEPDRDVTRFLWLKDPNKLSTENNLQIYRFARIPFGIVSSPFLLSATVDYHLKHDGSETAIKILQNIYVDNVITGVDTEAEAVKFYERAKTLFSNASMNIREWMSNSSKFLENIPIVDRATGKTKILGLLWNTENDSLLVYTPQEKEFTNNPTKRSVLKFTASVFDPLGLFSPVLLQAKQFLHKLWQQKFDWDCELPAELQSEWREIAQNTNLISTYAIDRFVGIPFQNKVKCEVHCFCDASQLAYGISIYLRVITPNSILSNLLFAKCRLAPLRSDMSIPRLELLAVHMGGNV